MTFYETKEAAAKQAAKKGEFRLLNQGYECSARSVREPVIEPQPAYAKSTELVPDEPSQIVLHGRWGEKEAYVTIRFAKQAEGWVIDSTIDFQLGGPGSLRDDPDDFAVRH